MNAEKWKVNRLKGKRHFIFKHGVLNWGLSTAILWIIVMHFAQPIEPMWVRPLIALVLFPLGGMLFGHFVWCSSEAKFKELTEQSDAQQRS